MWDLYLYIIFVIILLYIKELCEIYIYIYNEKNIIICIILLYIIQDLYILWNNYARFFTCPANNVYISILE